jgi:hypothetical protein
MCTNNASNNGCGTAMTNDKKTRQQNFVSDETVPSIRTESNRIRMETGLETKEWNWNWIGNNNEKGRRKEKKPFIR